MKRIIGIVLLVISSLFLIWELNGFPLEGSMGAIFTATSILFFFIGIGLIVKIKDEDLISFIIDFIVELFT